MCVAGGSLLIPEKAAKPAAPPPKPIELTKKVKEAPTLSKKLLTEGTGSVGLSSLRIPLVVN